MAKETDLGRSMLPGHPKGSGKRRRPLSPRARRRLEELLESPYMQRRLAYLIDTDPRMREWAEDQVRGRSRQQDSETGESLLDVLTRVSAAETDDLTNPDGASAAPAEPKKGEDDEPGTAAGS